MNRMLFLAKDLGKEVGFSSAWEGLFLLKGIAYYRLAGPN